MATASAGSGTDPCGRSQYRTGGKALLAAVAVSAALAVVEPYGSGLGGGGFWLLHRASDERQVLAAYAEDGRTRDTDHRFGFCAGDAGAGKEEGAGGRRA